MRPITSESRTEFSIVIPKAMGCIIRPAIKIIVIFSRILLTSSRKFIFRSVAAITNTLSVRDR